MTIDILNLIKSHEAHAEALIQAGDFENAAKTFDKAHYLSHALYLNTGEFQYLKESSTFSHKREYCYSKFFAEKG